MMHRLITIYLSQDTSRRVHEHLVDDLAAGWRIKSIDCFGGGTGSGYDYHTSDGHVAGWVVVVLERDPA